MNESPWKKARRLAALLALGQGLLVVTGVLDHEAPFAVGVALVFLSILLLLPDLRRASSERGDARASRSLALATAGLGVIAVVGVLTYNALARSTLGVPEAATLLYGFALVAASVRLNRRLFGVRVERLVALSFPLVLAPLSLYALDAAIAAQLGARPLAIYVKHGLVAPMAAVLAGAGLDVSTSGETLRIATDRGSLFLTVGVVCAGLYAGVIFLGVFALFAYEARLPAARTALYLALGLAGLHVANVLRLVLLAVVGWKWGGSALQTVHAHAGWILFIAWTVAYWALVLRRFEVSAPGSRSSRGSPSSRP